MKLTILQQDLYPAIQTVSRSVGIRNTLPVLSNILLEAEATSLKLSATNLEIGIINTTPANISEEGRLTVPARTFLEIISSLSNSQITLETKGDKLLISTDSFNGSINGISADEFPSIPLSSENTIEIEATVLQKSLPEITFAAATDDGRPVLTGILTEIKKDILELVATDGFRLAHKNTKLSNDKYSFKSLIPRRTFEEVVRVIGEESGQENKIVKISTAKDQNQMIFEIGNTQISSRLIEGNYPSWEKIIPEKFENTTILDRSQLIKALKLASVFTRGGANIIKIETDSTKLKITSEAQELGSQQTEVEAEIEGSSITIAFNSRFIVDALNAMSVEKVKIRFAGNLSAALITPIGEAGLEYVVMPIRIS